MKFKELVEHLKKLQPADMEKSVMLLSPEGFEPVTLVWDMTSDALFFTPAVPLEDGEPEPDEVEAEEVPEEKKESTPHVRRRP